MVTARGGVARKALVQEHTPTREKHEGDFLLACFGWILTKILLYQARLPVLAEIPGFFDVNGFSKLAEYAAFLHQPRIQEKTQGQ